jgi:hypothetical protein
MLKTPWALRDTKYPPPLPPPSSFVSRCYWTPCPTTTATTWPPRGSYLSSFVERHWLALEAFIVDRDCFLDCRTLPCSTRTFVWVWIWNPFKYRAFKFFRFLSRKAQDCDSSRTKTKFNSLLKFKVRQILIRFLANPQPYIWHKPPHKLQWLATLLWQTWVIVVLKIIVVCFEFHL